MWRWVPSPITFFTAVLAFFTVVLAISTSIQVWAFIESERAFVNIDIVGVEGGRSRRGGQSYCGSSTDRVSSLGQIAERLLGIILDELHPTNSPGYQRSLHNLSGPLDWSSTGIVKAIFKWENSPPGEWEASTLHTIVVHLGDDDVAAAMSQMWTWPPPSV